LTLWLLLRTFIEHQLDINIENMNNLQSISNQIQKLQSEYNKRMKELNRQLEEAIHSAKVESLTQIEINPLSPVTDLDISFRAYQVVKAMGIVTIGDFLKLTQARLMAQRNCGKKTLTEIEYHIFELQLGLELPLK
jgi:DNA-directed RNA polymerase alpha subunit